MAVELATKNSSSVASLRRRRWLTLLAHTKTGNPGSDGLPQGYLGEPLLPTMPHARVTSPCPSDRRRLLRSASTGHRQSPSAPLRGLVWQAVRQLRAQSGRRRARPPLGSLPSGRERCCAPRREGGERRPLRTRDFCSRHPWYHGLQEAMSKSSCAQHP